MSDTEPAERPSADDVNTPQSALEEIRDRNERLRAQNEELERQLMSVEADRNKLRQEVSHLESRMRSFTTNPLFVATVEDFVERGVVVKQHGNNQEAVTPLPDDLREELEVGDRVAINNSLSVVEKLTDDVDARARAMEVKESPAVDYSDIGGVSDQMQDIRETVELPLKEPERFADLGIDPPSGILMHGPPGTGKTMLAKAVANQTDSTFIKLAGSELVHKFLGEGSRLVRDLFTTAREHEPAVIFIDEIDAIASKRTDSKTSGNAEVQRTLMQLLAELDGFESRGDIQVIAATNRYDMLDEALLRPGRFDRILEVPKPTTPGRREIFEIHLRGMNVDDDVDTNELADKTTGASGAEIEAICTEAGMVALRENRPSITADDFDSAIDKIVGGGEEENESTYTVSRSYD